jgi:hypothetical protein
MEKCNNRRLLVIHMEMDEDEANAVLRKRNSGFLLQYQLLVPHNEAQISSPKKTLKRNRLLQKSLLH